MMRPIKGTVPLVAAAMLAASGCGQATGIASPPSASPVTPAPTTAELRPELADGLTAFSGFVTDEVKRMNEQWGMADNNQYVPEAGGWQVTIDVGLELDEAQLDDPLAQLPTTASTT